MRLRFAVLACLLMLPACASLPPFNFSVPDVQASSRKLDADVRSITVTIAPPSEQTGPVDPGTHIITDMWKEALQETLDRSAIFTDVSPNKVSIAVKILKTDIPKIGITFTSRISARYDLISRVSGAVVFSKTVESEGTVPAGYAYLGLTRQRESINRAVQNNILEFLTSLKEANLSFGSAATGNAPTGSP